MTMREWPRARLALTSGLAVAAASSGCTGVSKTETTYEDAKAAWEKKGIPSDFYLTKEEWIRGWDLDSGGGKIAPSDLTAEETKARQTSRMPRVQRSLPHTPSISVPITPDPMTTRSPAGGFGEGGGGGGGGGGGH